MHSFHPETKTAGIKKLEMQAELLNCFFFKAYFLSELWIDVLILRRDRV